MAWSRIVTFLALFAGWSAAWSIQPLGCLIDASRVAEVGSSAIGVVASVDMERGDFVRKGQTLAVLRGDVERANVEVARAKAQSDADVQAAAANRDFTRQRLQRAEDLFGKKFISQQALDQARAEAEVAERKYHLALDQQRIWRQELEVANAQLAQRTIRSPFDGVIAERYVSVGERVEERPLMRVVAIDPLRVEVVVSANEFGKIQKDATAHVIPDLPGQASFKAKVVLVDKVIDPASNTFRVRLELPNRDKRLPAGVRCRAEFGDSVAAAKPPQAEPQAAKLSLEDKPPIRRSSAQRVP